MAKVGRNDACPCGSELKYKKCCLPGDEASRPMVRQEKKARRSDARMADGAAQPPTTVRAKAPPPPAWLRFVPAIMATVGLGLAVWAAIAVSVTSALAVTGATAFAIGAWVVFSDPPPADGGDKNPSGLNFGR